MANPNGFIIYIRFWKGDKNNICSWKALNFARYGNIILAIRGQVGGYLMEKGVKILEEYIRKICKDTSKVNIENVIHIVKNKKRC